jgi:hypothetical protein
MDGGTVRVMLRGPFAIVDRDGTDRTPVAQKERALIALLAVAPERKRARLWLADKLWSDRDAEQAATSLRRALSNLRATFGTESEILHTDRNSVWLGSHVVADLRPDLMAQSEILEDLNVRDPEFENWLRDLRQMHDREPEASAIECPVPRRARSGATEIVICRTAPPQGSEESFLASLLSDGLSSRFNALGDATVRVLDRGDDTADEDDDRAAVIRIEVESVTAGGDWLVHLRAVANRNRQFLWSGRLRVPLDLGRIFGGAEVAGFVSRATTGIVGSYDIHCAGERDPFLSVQRSARRLFTGRPSEIRLAQDELAELPLGDRSGIVLAWRSFGRLTEALELGVVDADLVGEAKQLAEEAVARSAENPLVLSLAAQVQMKLGADHELGAYLARRSCDKNDQDPYALHALSQARFFAGHHARSHDLAKRAREAAEGLPNAHVWDMRLALSKLGFGDIDGALQLCSAAHVKSGSYRPALRYLVALNLIRGEMTSATRHARALAQMESGFKPGDLLRPGYPLETLRLAGLVEDLAGAVDEAGLRVA